MILVISSNCDLVKSLDRSKLVRKQKQIIRNGKPVITYVWVNPNRLKKINNIKRLIVNKDFTIDMNDSYVLVNPNYINDFFKDLKTSSANYTIKEIFKNFNKLEAMGDSKLIIFSIDKMSLSGSSNKNIIYIKNENSKNNESAFFHELTHRLDEYLGIRLGYDKVSSNFLRFKKAVADNKIENIPENCQSFLNKFDYLRKNVNTEESKKYLDEELKYIKLNKNETNEDKKKEYKIKINQAYTKFLVKYDEEMFPNEYYKYGSLAGILSSLSGGKLTEEKKIVDGHEPEYYKYLNDAESEILADYLSMSIVSPEALNVFKQDFPELNNELESVVNSIYKFIIGDKNE